MALHNGLEASPLVLLLVSQKVVDGIAHNAPMRRDNVLLEWEVTVDRIRAGDCMCLPVRGP